MLLLGLVVGLVIGFLVGRFGKKMLAALKDMLSKAPKPPAAADDGDADPIMDEDLDDPQQLNAFLDAFLDADHTAGIDDNPEVSVNPIFDYRIRKQKELDRLEFARKKAEEEGLTLEEGGDDVAADGAQHKNALATLIEAGARVTSVQSAQSAAAQAASEARRQTKNIETFLAKYMDIDVSTTNKRESRKRNTAKPTMSAYDKAMQTRDATPGQQTVKVAISAAKRSRGQLRAILHKRPDLGKGERRNERLSLTDVNTVQEEAGGARGSAALRGSDAVATDADGDAEGEEGDEEDGEEGEEGEEGAGEDYDDELAA